MAATFASNCFFCSSVKERLDGVIAFRRDLPALFLRSGHVTATAASSGHHFLRLAGRLHENGVDLHDRCGRKRDVLEQHSLVRARRCSGVICWPPPPPPPCA
jgi:hypothetical protein